MNWPIVSTAWKALGQDEKKQSIVSEHWPCAPDSYPRCRRSPAFRMILHERPPGHLKPEPPLEHSMPGSSVSILS